MAGESKSKLKLFATKTTMTPIITEEKSILTKHNLTCQEDICIKRSAAQNKSELIDYQISATEIDLRARRKYNQLNLKRLKRFPCTVIIVTSIISLITYPMKSLGQKWDAMIVQLSIYSIYSEKIDKFKLDNTR